MMRVKCIRPAVGLTVGNMYTVVDDDRERGRIMVIDDSEDQIYHDDYHFSVGAIRRAIDKSLLRVERAVVKLGPEEVSQKQYVEAQNELLGRVEMLLELLEELQEGEESSPDLVDSMNLVDRVVGKYGVVVSLLSKDNV